MEFRSIDRQDRRGKVKETHKDNAASEGRHARPEEVIKIIPTDHDTAQGNTEYPEKRHHATRCGQSSC